MRHVSIQVLAWGLVILSSPAYAHRPTMSDGSAVDADHAIEFQDVQISRVVYHEVTKQAPRVWTHVRGRSAPRVVFADWHASPGPAAEVPANPGTDRTGAARGAFALRGFQAVSGA